MKKSTDKIHEALVRLGERMGFVAQREVHDSLLALRVGDAYQPRIDLMWSLPLSSAQRGAIAKVTGDSLDRVVHLPVVGIEVEGSGPTTKTLMADIANLRALGAPLGLLVVDEQAEAGQYRRASRAIRTVRRNLGDLAVVPMEGFWASKLAKRQWDARPSVLEAPARKTARGGERTKWTARAREHLVALGQKAGFVVEDPYTLKVPETRFEAERARRAAPMHEMWSPFTCEQREMKRGDQFMTASEIDMAWTLPLPRSLRDLLLELVAIDPAIVEHDLVFPEVWDRVPVVGFELDSSPGKHGGGGLLNLSAYCVIGVTFTPNDATTLKLEAARRTYVQALGLRNIYVRTAP